jgi:hypothetical protein
VQDVLTSEQSHGIVMRVLDLLKILLANDNTTNEVCDFFSSDHKGLWILAHLLQQYTERKGCSQDLADKIINFTLFEISRWR